MNIKFWIFFVLILGLGSVFELFYPIAVQLIELLLVILLLIKQKHTTKGNLKTYLFIIYTCVVLSSILTNTSIVNYTSLLLRPLFALLILLAFDYDYDEIKYYFSKVLRFVALVATANWILITFVPGVFSVNTASSGYSVNTILYIFNYVNSGITERFGVTFIRNQGIFWEPGVLGLVMNVLIFIELFEYNKKFKSIALPALVLISTASTVSYMLFSLLLFIKYFEKIRNGRNLSKRFFAILSAFVVFGAFTPLLLNEVTYKSTEGVGSANKRQYDMMMGIAIVKDNPIIGIGPSKDRYAAEANKYNIFVGENVTYDSRASSNLFTTLFASYGIPLALLFLYSFYRQYIFLHKKLFLLVTIVGLMSEPVVFIDLYFLWIMSGTYKNRKINYSK